MIKIIHNNIELPTVPESVQVQKDRDVFKDSLNINYTDKPFLIQENSITKQALGMANIATANAQIYNVQVLDGFVLYSGRLYITNILDGFREAELVYTNNLIDEFEKEIATFYTNIHINNGVESTYEETTEVDFDDTPWVSFVEDKLPRTFPEVDFNFPTIKYPSKMEDKDDWTAFKGEINAKNIDKVYVNSNTTALLNQNIIVPFYYLLSPLYKAFKETYGYTVTGDFVEHDTIKKTLLHHKEDLLVAIEQTNEDETFKLYKHHLTIEPERFLPEWTLAEYINNLKNRFNLEVLIDQVTKTISLNFAQEIYKTTPVDVSKYKFSKILEAEPTRINNYILADASGLDLINISLTDITTLDTELDTERIDTAFKQLPAEITLDWEELEGVGLLIYDYFENDTYHIQELNGLNHAIYGDNGTANNFWLSWFITRLKAKNVPTTVVCSAYQKKVLETARSIYFNNQKFHIVATNAKSLSRNYEVELDLITASQ